jgi:hypothetical protein
MLFEICSCGRNTREQSEKHLIKAAGLLAYFHISTMETYFGSAPVLLRASAALASLHIFADNRQKRVFCPRRLIGQHSCALRHGYARFKDKCISMQKRKYTPG